MAEVIQVPVDGHNVPGVPGAQATPPGVPPLPSGAQQIAGFAPNAGPGTFTQADVDRQVAAALLAAKSNAGGLPQPATAASAPVSITTEASDPVLSAYTESFSAIGQGIDVERAIGKALQFGKAELIDTAYIAEKGGAQARQLEVIAKAIVERVNTQTQAGVVATHTAAGGEDSWNAASAAFQTNAPEHLKQVVIEMLNSGKQDKIQAAAKMVVQYAQDGGLISRPAGMVQAGVAGGIPSQALDSVGFKAALQKLNKQDPNWHQQRDALFAARKQGKDRGMQ